MPADSDEEYELCCCNHYHCCSLSTTSMLHPSPYPTHHCQTHTNTHTHAHLHTYQTPPGFLLSLTKHYILRCFKACLQLVFQNFFTERCMSFLIKKKEPHSNLKHADSLDCQRQLLLQWWLAFSRKSKEIKQSLTF